HLTRLAALREYFDPDVRVRLDDRELTSRDAVMRELTRLQPPTGGLGVEFVNITTALAADQQTAAVTLTVRLSSTNRSGVSTVDDHVADVTMRKLEGDWVISAATLRPLSASEQRLHQRLAVFDFLLHELRDP